MTTTPETPAPWASDDDVKTILGNVGDRLPDRIKLADYLAAATAEARDRLTDVYGLKLPRFEGDGREAVRWAVAKLAAAEVVDALRVGRSDDSTTAEHLRASSFRVLDRGVPGYRPGDPDTTPGDGGEGGTPERGAITTPTVSSFTPVSAFADPYASVRDGRYVGL